MWAGAAFLFLLFAPSTDYQAEGLKALDARQYDQAIQLFTQAIQADPKDYGAHFNLALAYSFLGKDVEAIPEYQKTLELKPGLYQAELNLSILLLKNKHAKEALPHLEAAVQAKPRQFRAERYLAEAYLALGALPSAEQHCQAAAELEPKSAAAQFGLARAKGLLELAGLYKKNHEPAQAMAIYQKFPDNVAAQERLGKLLLESQRFSEAIPYLEKAVARDPTAANRLALATAYRMNKELQKALDQLKQAVAVEPGNYDLRMTYGRCLRDERMFMAAAQEFRAAAERKADSAEAWNEMAGVLTLAGDYGNALAALDRVRSLGREIPGDYFLRAIILDKMHDYKSALESYEKFLDTSVGKNPDEEFQARQRVRIIQHILSKR